MNAVEHDIYGAHLHAPGMKTQDENDDDDGKSERQREMKKKILKSSHLFKIRWKFITDIDWFRKI